MRSIHLTFIASFPKIELFRSIFWCLVDYFITQTIKLSLILQRYQFGVAVQRWLVPSQRLKRLSWLVEFCQRFPEIWTTAPEITPTQNQKWLPRGGVSSSQQKYNFQCLRRFSLLSVSSCLPPVSYLLLLHTSTTTVNRWNDRSISQNDRIYSWFMICILIAID